MLYSRPGFEEKNATSLSKIKGHVQNPTASKSTQSNLKTAYQSRVRVWGNSDSEK